MVLTVAITTERGPKITFYQTYCSLLFLDANFLVKLTVYWSVGCTRARIGLVITFLRLSGAAVQSPVRVKVQKTDQWSSSLF